MIDLNKIEKYKENNRIEAKKATGGDGENPEGGRPTKESQGETVSDKTIQNKESQN